MKDYTEKNPVFMDTIQITETSDPAHADNINAAPMQLLQNTLANKKEIDELKKGSNEVEFDDSGTGTDIPGGGGEEPGENLNPADAIDQITSGKSVPTLIGHIKTALRGLLSLSQNLQTLFFEKISGLPGLIGRAYSEEQVYGIGEYCTHEERFYKFTGSKEIGAWDPDKVQEVTVAEELVRQRAAVQEIVDSMGNPDAYDPNRVYMAGDFCIQNNQMYKRNADMAEDTELPHPWDETEWTATSIAEEIRQLNVNMASFKQTKSEIVGSGLGQALALTSDSLWAQIVSKIKSVANRGAWNGSISASGGSVTIPAGYHDGKGKVKGPTFTVAGTGAANCYYNIANSKYEPLYGSYTCPWDGIYIMAVSAVAASGVASISNSSNAKLLASGGTNGSNARARVGVFYAKAGQVLSCSTSAAHATCTVMMVW